MLVVWVGWLACWSILFETFKKTHVTTEKEGGKETDRGRGRDWKTGWDRLQNAVRYTETSILLWLKHAIANLCKQPNSDSILKYQTKPLQSWHRNYWHQHNSQKCNAKVNMHWWWQWLQTYLPSNTADTKRMCRSMCTSLLDSNQYKLSHHTTHSETGIHDRDLWSVSPGTHKMLNVLLYRYLVSIIII